MRLEFENWIEETKLFSEKGEILIREGIKCFKADAFRGAFLLSYLAFKISLRDKLLASNYINSKRNEQEWKGKVKGLEKEEEWEKHFDGLVFNTKDGFNIYELSEDLLKEYTYWRKKRNDCAHAKSEIFSQATIQMFWDFLRINFVKFQVLGEKEYLISRLFDDFKYHKDEGNSIITIKQLSSLDNADIVDVLSKVDSEIGKHFDCRYDIDKLFGLDIFWKRIKEADKSVKDAFLTFICKDFSTFDKFNKVMPELLELIRESNPNFINEKIIEKIYLERFYNVRMWFYAVELLKNMDENTTRQFIDKITLSAPYYQPNDIEIETLKKMGYFQSWKKRLFDEKKINRSSSGTSYIGDYNNRKNIYIVLDNIEWDESVFGGIEEVIEWDNYIHGRINSTSDYYDFIEFQNELISNDKYKNRVKDCIQKYRCFDVEKYPYVRYFIRDTNVEKGDE